MLDQEFAADGIACNWHEITSGAKQAEAMAAGSWTSPRCITPPSVLLANAGGIRARHRRRERQARLLPLWPAKTAQKTIAGLKGKMVAGPKGTVLHQTLLAALAKEGMKADDVQFVSMDLPKARAAMSRGRWTPHCLRPA
jgi:NitT/TauT family transport system substrate-binding protein/sulfonate transport system substrate-binding protein